MYTAMIHFEGNAIVMAMLVELSARHLVDAPSKAVCQCQ
jgi:hypothetical protein